MGRLPDITGFGTWGRFEISILGILTGLDNDDTVLSSMHTSCNARPWKTLRRAKSGSIHASYKIYCDRSNVSLNLTSFQCILTSVFSFSLVGIAASKASVAAFLLRITIHQWHKWTLYILIFIVTVSCFICALFDYIRCDPIESIWNFFIPGKCWMDAKGFTTLSAVVGGISAAVDFILAILPWFILWNLQMKRKDKNLIATSMSLGFFAGVCGIIRTTTVERIFTGVDYSCKHPFVRIKYQTNTNSQKMRQSA